MLLCFSFFHLEFWLFLSGATCFGSCLFGNSSINEPSHNRGGFVSNGQTGFSFTHSLMLRKADLQVWSEQAFCCFVSEREDVSSGCLTGESIISRRQ